MRKTTEKYEAAAKRSKSPRQRAAERASGRPAPKPKKGRRSESEKRFREFFEWAPVYCYIISPEGLIMDVNRLALRVLGYRKKELIGQPVRKIYAPESQKKMRDLFARWGKTGRIKDAKMIIVTKKGNKRSVLLSSSAVRGADKKILHSISVQKDVTDQDRLEEKEEHLNIVLRSILTVRQVISREKDNPGLLQGACDALNRDRGYENSWIALTDHSGNLLHWAESGRAGKFVTLVKRWQAGDPPSCLRRALKRAGAIVVRDPPSECPDCPLSPGYRGRKGMSIRLEYGKVIFGVLTVSLPAHIPSEEDERSLLAEIARDIAFAIHNLKMREARQRAEAKIRELSKFPSENPNPVMRIDRDGIILYANPPSSLILKVWGCRVGRKLPDQWHRLISEALGFGEPRDAEMTCGDRLFLLTFAPLQDAGYVNVYGLDITERQKAEEAEHLKKLMESLIDFQEEERRRVSRELHDQIGQLLTAVKLHLRMISRDHPGLGEPVLRRLDRAGDLLDRAQEDARRISARLRPDTLDDFGLSAAIENEIATLSTLSGLEITFSPRKEENRLDPRKEVALYRVAQEALTNIIRHSGASAATVHIEESSGKVLLRVSDNGKGLPPGEKKPVSMGILGMKERLASVKGVLRIEPGPGGGTVLEAEVPL